jgi:alpha-beta hydrolase superfamily lysophospholipase
MRRPPAARPLPLVPRWSLISVAALVLLGGATLALRWYAGRRAAQAMIVPARADSTTPRSLGVPYTDLQIPSGDHTIHAWWVRGAPPAPAPVAAASRSTKAGRPTGARRSAAPAAPAASPAPAAPPAPAVLLLHGNRTSLAQQAGIQQVLYRAGISSLAFDYSGFGASGGSPDPAALRRDAHAAAAVFNDSARSASRRVLLGTSLGAAVLLDAIADLEPACDGVVLVGPFTSARDLAVLHGRVPHWLAWLLPDLYDNVAAIQRLTKPVLIVASVRDSVFPIAGVDRLFAAAAEPKQLARLEHTGHDAYLATDESWRPVIAFIRQGPD